MESSGAHRLSSSIVAIVGDDEVLASQLTLSLPAFGLQVVRLDASKWLEDPPAHGLAVLIGAAASQGGRPILSKALERAGAVAVVLPEGALGDRLAAHRLGAKVITRREAAGAMASDLAAIARGKGAGEPGWTAMAALVDQLERALAEKLGGRPGVRIDVKLDEIDRVIEVLDKCAADLAALATEARVQTELAVTVDGLNWDDDPQTAQQSDAEIARWRRIAARGAALANAESGAEKIVIVEKTIEKKSAKKPTSGVQVAVSLPASEPEEDFTDPNAAPLPLVRRPDVEETSPWAAQQAPAEEPLPDLPPPVAAPAPKKSSRVWIVLAVLGVLAFFGLLFAAGTVLLVPRASNEAIEDEPSSAPRVASTPPDRARPAIEPRPPETEPQREPEPPEPAPSANVEALLRDAAANERAGAWDRARAAYDAVLVIDDRNPHAIAGIARERIAAGDLAEAIARAERAVSLRRRRASYRVLLGDAHRAAGHGAQARAAYEAALEIDPNDAEARQRLGQ